jgi:outer membrane murein-binding lipoprotein Lpp
MKKSRLAVVMAVVLSMGVLAGCCAMCALHGLFHKDHDSSGSDSAKHEHTDTKENTTGRADTDSQSK